MKKESRNNLRTIVVGGLAAAAVIGGVIAIEAGQATAGTDSVSYAHSGPSPRGPGH